MCGIFMKSVTYINSCTLNKTKMYCRDLQNKLIVLIKIFKQKGE